MPILSLLSLLILLVALQVMPSHAAQPNTLRCDACTDERIQQIFASDPAITDTYVLDMVRRQVRHHYRDHLQGGSVPEVSLAPREWEYWQLVQRYYDGNRGNFAHLDHLQLELTRSSAGRIELQQLELLEGAASRPGQPRASPPFALTAVELAAHPPWRDDVAALLTAALRSRELDIFAHLAEYTKLSVQDIHALFGVGYADAVPFSIPRQTMLVETGFADGSSARWAWRPREQQFRWVPHSARDAAQRFIDDQTTSFVEIPSAPVLGHLGGKPSRCRWSPARSAVGYLSPGVQRSIAHLGCQDD